MSVFLPYLPTDRLLRGASWRDSYGRDSLGRDSLGPDAPFALWRKIKGGERLAAVNAAARRRGLKPGMPAADARALCPSLRLEEQDPIAETTALETIADWHRRFTPLSACDPPDGVLLDVTGAAGLFGGEAKLLDEIESRLAAQGFSARAALAPGPALARALARFSLLRLAPAQASQQEIEQITAGLPVAALDLPEPQARRLARAGLRSVGDLLARPRAPLAARLGQEAMARFDALACRRREPITPRFEAPDFMVERRFPDGLTQMADVERVLKQLAAELCAPLERHGVGARKLEAEFFRVDGAVKRLIVGTSRPLRDGDRIFALLRERLGRLAEEGLDAGYGFDVLRLGAALVERLDPAQLDHAAIGRNRPIDACDLDDLVDRLSARLGDSRVQRLHLQARHWPEAAVALLPASYPEPQADCVEAYPAYARPLRLFERPEPIEPAGVLPQGPPRRFRWRRLWRETAAYEGPERIEPPWWRAPQRAVARDYFVVVDADGARFWLYRENQEKERRWFVHGLF